MDRELIDNNGYKLPIKNKDGGISYVIIDKKTFDYLSNKKYSIYFKDNRNECVLICINNIRYPLHSYVYYIIYGNKEGKIKAIISHINLIKLDNRMENLKNNKAIVVKIIDKNTCKIPVKNSEGNIVYTILDIVTVNYLNDKVYSLSMQKNEYVYIFIDNKTHALHRYIYFTVYGNNEETKVDISHINLIKLDNRMENLKTDIMNIKVIDENTHGIPIKNKKGDIVFVLIDKKTLDYLSDKTYLVSINNKSEYIQITINNKTQLFHRYVYYTIYENNDKEGLKTFISHIDTIVLNNKMENLRNNKLYKKMNNPIVENRLDILNDNKLLVETNKMEILKQLEKSSNKLPIKNKDGKIFYTFVDQKTVDYLKDKKYSLSKDKNSYILIFIDNTNYKLHRYIYYNIYGNKEDETKPIIDHINSITIDNRIENLRDDTHANNNRNRNKAEKASSIYYGVSYDKKSNTYICFLKHEDINYRFQFQNELHAAYQYNMLVKKFNITSARLNDISQPEGFVMKEQRTKASGLEHGIQKFGNKYCYVFKCKPYGGFDTPEEALVARNKKIEEYNIEVENKILSAPIKRNKDGIAIIELFNDEKVKTGETLVDDDIYYNLMHYRWYLDTGGYVCGTVNKKTVRLSRFVMNYTGKEYIDHIDGTPLNNQKGNLRIANPRENMQNKSSAKNSISKYVGVSYSKHHKKWSASLKTKETKSRHIGFFSTEIEAAEARDKRAIELNNTQGAFYKLNLLI